MSAYIFIFFLSIYCFVVRLRQVDGLSCPDGRTDEPLAVEKMFCKLHCCWRSPEAAAVAVAYVSVRWRLWLGSTWEICAWGLSFLRFISETNDGVKGYVCVCVPWAFSTAGNSFPDRPVLNNFTHTHNLVCIGLTAEELLLLPVH